MSNCRCTNNSNSTSWQIIIFDKYQGSLGVSDIFKYSEGRISTVGCTFTGSEKVSLRVIFGMFSKFIKYKYRVLRYNCVIMGNKCLTPCTGSTPLTDVKSKFRCSYFCCLKGATINVTHTNTDMDETDGVKSEKIICEDNSDISSENGIYGNRHIAETTI